MKKQLFALIWISIIVLSTISLNSMEDNKSLENQIFNIHPITFNYDDDESAKEYDLITIDIDNTLTDLNLDAIPQVHMFQSQSSRSFDLRARPEWSYYKPILICKDKKIKDTQEDINNALRAKEHNHNNILLNMPSDVLMHIFSYCHAQEMRTRFLSKARTYDQTESLKSSIERFMKLCTTCSHFNTFLTAKAIGNLCTSYTQEAKNETLQKLLCWMGTINHERYKSAFILIHAGVDVNTKVYTSCLLERALETSNTELITTLFAHSADPNTTAFDNIPVFFKAKTKAILQFFVDKNINIHAEREGLNVLWFCEFKPELIEFYLHHKVDATKLHPKNKSCLLHRLAESVNTDNMDNYLKVGEMLFNATPKEIINTINNKGLTPLDIAQEYLELLIRHKISSHKQLEKFIALYRKHECKTAKELRQLAQDTENRPCIICYETTDNMIDLPCTNFHPERVCAHGCYSTLLAHSDKCPLCRESFVEINYGIQCGIYGAMAFDVD